MCLGYQSLTLVAIPLPWLLVLYLCNHSYYLCCHCWLPFHYHGCWSCTLWSPFLLPWLPVMYLCCQSFYLCCQTFYLRCQSFYLGCQSCTLVTSPFTLVANHVPWLPASGQYPHTSALTRQAWTCHPWAGSPACRSPPPSGCSRSPARFASSLPIPYKRNECEKHNQSRLCKFDPLLFPFFHSIPERWSQIGLGRLTPLPPRPSSVAFGSKGYIIEPKTSQMSLKWESFADEFFIFK